MPRGSKIGERRGGREFGTPNRRTVLANRILALAPEHPKASASQFVDILVQDRQLPADIRMAIAVEFSPAGASRSEVAKSSVEQRPRAGSAGVRRVPSRTAKLASLEMLLSIAQDTSAHPVQRRKAAAEAAQYVLPKTPGPKRWWNNAPIDEYGFAITPEIAAEYRDLKYNLQSSLNREKIIQRLRKRGKSCGRAWTRSCIDCRLPARLSMGSITLMQTLDDCTILRVSATTPSRSARAKMRRRRAAKPDLIVSAQDPRSRRGNAYKH